MDYNITKAFIYALANPMSKVLVYTNEPTRVIEERFTTCLAASPKDCIGRVSLGNLFVEFHNGSRVILRNNTQALRGCEFNEILVGRISKDDLGLVTSRLKEYRRNDLECATKTDVAGKPLVVGSKVAFCVVGYSQLKCGSVVKINPKSVTVEYEEEGRIRKVVRYSNQLAKLWEYN